MIRCWLKCFILLVYIVLRIMNDEQSWDVLLLLNSENSWTPMLELTHGRILRSIGMIRTSSTASKFRFCLNFVSSYIFNHNPDICCSNATMQWMATKSRWLISIERLTLSINQMTSTDSITGSWIAPIMRHRFWMNSTPHGLELLLASARPINDPSLKPCPSITLGRHRQGSNVDWTADVLHVWDPCSSHLRHW